MPLHYVTVEFRLRAEGGDGGDTNTTGQHRFLYGVEAWIEGVDQHLENLIADERVELALDPGAAEMAADRLLNQVGSPGVAERMVLELRVLEVVIAEPVEVVKALAATVNCCDDCGTH
jgi:hypothetical protein